MSLKLSLLLLLSVALLHTGDASTLFKERQTAKQDLIPSSTEQMVNHIAELLISGVSALLRSICNLAAPALTAIETFRETILVNVVEAVRSLAQIFGGVPMYSLLLNIILQVLTIANEMIASANSYINKNGCSMTSTSATNIIDYSLNEVAKLF
ncbi:unnamed protein product [Callosobruchus maculatus]|uniref:Uncharacterized protein n=1 Tax=Callosobruchus maculatus TaxID=64391 RepID=A0A653BJ73_CALMS|nr:unnamed protein product [Callosobruchus maculatus]